MGIKWPRLLLSGQKLHPSSLISLRLCGLQGKDKHRYELLTRSDAAADWTSSRGTQWRPDKETQADQWEAPSPPTHSHCWGEINAKAVWHQTPEKKKIGFIPNHLNDHYSEAMNLNVQHWVRRADATNTHIWGAGIMNTCKKTDVIDRWRPCSHRLWIKNTLKERSSSKPALRASGSLTNQMFLMGKVMGLQLRTFNFHLARKTSTHATREKHKPSQWTDAFYFLSVWTQIPFELLWQDSAAELEVHIRASQRSL